MFTLRCKGRLLAIDEPVVMGIINCTPDSFYAGSRRQTIDSILAQAMQMHAEGAAILDIGGQSTRPGSEPLSEAEELQRVTGPIAAIHAALPDAIISIDTYYASVARAAVHAGASMVNDISGGELDPAMLQAVADMHVPYVLMHMPGNPQTMQSLTNYNDVVTEVLDYLLQRAAIVRAAGIHDVIIDPGFGFGKTIAQNFQLLQQLPAFRMLGCPLLAGLSRKATIYKTLGVSADESLNGTTVLNTLALVNGASILRVHDVKAAKEAITLYSHYKR